MKNKFDYIFCGYGLSSCIILYKMSSENFFRNKSILVIENSSVEINKTWCFWDNKDSIWSDFIDKKWSDIRFKNIDTEIDYDLKQLRYNMISSSKFFKKIKKIVESKLKISLVYDDVLNISDENETVNVRSKNGQYTANKVFNSIPKFTPYDDHKKFPKLLQHFKGWTIKTNTSCFDPSIATIMDFSIDQKNETRFFYLLPKKNNEALIEFTLFTKNLIEEKEYESEIKKYISSLNIKDYEIISKEKGVIPMTCYPYDKYNSSNLINIGTAGGWTKPSSGYTFRFIDKFSDKLISFLISGRSFKNFKFRNRYWFYDLIFLDVLFNKNSVGSVLFETMFKKNSFSSIFRFLDNEGSYWDDLRIINSFPKLMFIKSFLKNIPRIISTYL